MEPDSAPHETAIYLKAYMRYTCQTHQVSTLASCRGR